MQAWNQWGAPAAAAAAAAAAGYQGYSAPPPPATAPAAPPTVAPNSAYSLGYHQYYSTAPPLPGATSDFSGWSALQQQQWQQWQQWQQQFQQWQQQYGDKYQESMNAMMAASGAAPATAGTAPAPPPVGPDLGQPPPLPPPDPKTTVPPPPPDDKSTTDYYSSHPPYSAMSGKTHDSTDQSSYTSFMSGMPFTVPPPSVPPPPSHPPPPGQPPPTAQLPPPAPPPAQQVPPPPTSIPPPPTGVPPPPSSKPPDDFSNKGYASTTGPGTGKRPYDQDSGYQGGNESFGNEPTKKVRGDNYSSGDRSQSTGFQSGNREEKTSGSGNQRNSGGSSTGWSGNREKGEQGSATVPRISKEQPMQDNPDELLEAEKTFDIQFKHWEEQFAKWKEQNINHPDKVQYREYEAKWEAWKENLLQRRTQMRRKREAACRQQQQQQASPAGQGPQAQDNQTSGVSPLPGGEASKAGSADSTPVRGSSTGGRRGGAGTPSSASGYFSGGDASRASEDTMMKEKAQDNSSGFNFAAVGGGFVAQASAEDGEKAIRNFDGSSQAGFKDSQQSVPFLGKPDSVDKSKDTSQQENEPKEFISSKSVGGGGIPGLDLISEGKMGTESNNEREGEGEEEDEEEEPEEKQSLGLDKDERETHRSGFIGPVNVPPGLDSSGPGNQETEKPAGPESAASDKNKTPFSPSQGNAPNANQGLLGPAPHQGPGYGGTSGGFGSGQNAGPPGFRGPGPAQGPNAGSGLLGFPGSAPQGNFQSQPNFSGPPPTFPQPQGPPPGYGGGNAPPFGGGSMYNGPPPSNQNFRPGNANFGPNNQNFGPGNQQGFGSGGRGNFGNQGPPGNQQSGFGGNPPFGSQASQFSPDKGMNSQQGSFGGNAPGMLGPGGQGGNQNFNNRGPGGGPGPFGQNQLNPQAFTGSGANSGGAFPSNLNPQAFGMSSGLPTGNQNFGNKPPPLFGNKPGAGGGFGPNNQGPPPAGGNQGPSGSNGPSGLGGMGGPGGSGGPSGSSGPGGQSGPGGHSGPGSHGGPGGPSGTGGLGGPSGPSFGGPPGNWKDNEKGGWNRDGPGHDNFPGGRENRDNFSRDFRDREGFPGTRDNFDGPPRDGFFGGGMKDRFAPPGEQGGPSRDFDSRVPREDRDYRGEFDGRGGGRGRGRGFGGWQGDRGGGGGGRGGAGPGGGRGRFRDELGMNMEPPPSLLGDGPTSEGLKPWERKPDKEDSYRDRWMDDGPPRRFTEPPPPKGWMGPKGSDSRPWASGSGGSGGGGGGGSSSGGSSSGGVGRGDDRFGGPRGSWDRAPEWENLEPATVVDYGHRPAAGDAIPTGNAFPEPVQTFEYGHGSSARRPEGGPPGGPGPGGPPPPPRPSEQWRRDEPPPNFRGNRDRDERFHRGDRDWGRGGGGPGGGGPGGAGGGGGGWDHDRDFGKREPSRWERERDRDRGRPEMDSSRDRDRDRDRERERDRDRDREDKGRWGDDGDRGRSGSGDRWGRDRRDRDHREHRDHRSGDHRDGDKDWCGSNRMQPERHQERPPDDNFPPPPDAPPPPSFAPISSEPPARAVLIEDLLCPPGRVSRPSRLVMILRGPPGSGKTFVAKLIKDKEVEMGGSAPRILCLDDYFMVEMEKEDKDPETGRKITSKVMEYEYEAGMDKHYRSSLVKTFRKTVLDGYFPFIIVDCINDKVKHFEEMWSFAKQKGFQVYICEMDMDASTCTKRNIHNRSEKDILDIIKNWEETPKHYLRVDVRSLLQSVAITEVEMEDTTVEECPEDSTKPEDGIAIGEVTPGEGQEGDEELDYNPFTSKWERLEPRGEKLDRLDGLARRRKVDDQPKTLEDWLQLTDDYDRRGSGKPGEKRVRWADLEERCQQEKMRAIGFVVGQTDWSRMTDPTFGESALTQTKYI